MQLQICQRVPEVDPSLFWAAPVGAQAWRVTIDKYASLADCARLAAAPRGEEYKRALTELSRRWPGALREGELIGPDRVTARHRAAQAGAREGERARASWTETPALAALCWAELHVLIADVLAYRRSRSQVRPKRAFAWAELSSWLADTGRAARWPTPLLDEAGLGSKLEVRSAYLCFSARAGVELPRLNALLFAREGHWDRRAEDPPWAHP